jgi:anti-anti-sigma factor
MDIAATPSSDGTTLTLRTGERFDFTVQPALRAACAGARARCYVLDLRDTCYMDSSALGMLLQLREQAGGSREAIRIRNARPAIREILSVANLQQLMTIE